MLTKALRDNKRARLAVILAVALLLALALEFFLANGSRLFVYSKDRYPSVDPTEYCGEPLREDGSYLVLESGRLDFVDLPVGLYSLSFDIGYYHPATEGTIPAPNVRVTTDDPRTTWESGGFITVANEQIAIGEGGEFRRVTITASAPRDEIGDLRIAFSNLAGDVLVKNVTLNEPPAWTLSPVRVLLIALLLFLPALLAETGIRRTLYDPEDPKHRVAALTAVLPSVLIALFVSSMLLYKGVEIAYPLEGAIRGYQPYIQQFDALLKGQLHLDVPVSEELLGLENPYDYAERLHASALWDRAYYDGRYYSYFGMAPILVIYFPYYLVTGALPADRLVMSVFLLITSVFIPLTVIAWANLHEKRTLPLPLLWLGAFLAFPLSMMPLVARGVTPFYYIATLAGNAFLSVFLFLCLSGAAAKRLRSRVILYALAGVSYALLLHSRLNIALLLAFLIVPFLLFRVIRRREDSAPPEDEGKVTLLTRLRRYLAPTRELIPQLLALALPVLIGFAAAFYLNHARFGSILEFGTRYQLTVSDIRYNTVSLGNLFPAIYHYFFQPLQTSTQFPFVAIQRLSSYDYGHFVYIDAGLGLFSLPIFRTLLFSPALFLLKDRTRYERVLLAALLLGLVFLALLNFSLGGVIYRYTADMTTLAAIAAVVLVFAFYRAAAGISAPTKAEPAVSEETSGGAEADGMSSEADEGVSAETADTVSHETVGMIPSTSRERMAYAAVILFLVLSLSVALLLTVSQNGNLSRYPANTFIAIRDFLFFR